MGWTGGYVLLALLLAPYLRKFGKFTVPEFIGDRYYSKTARMVAVICLIVLGHLRDRPDDRAWASPSRASSR
jgi:cation/acetate symporter